METDFGLDQDHDLLSSSMSQMSSDLSSQSLRNVSQSKFKNRPQHSGDYDVPHVDPPLTTSIFDSPVRRPAIPSADSIRAQSIRQAPVSADQLFGMISADLVKQGYLTKPGVLRPQTLWCTLTPSFHLCGHKTQNDELKKSKPELKISLTPKCKIVHVGTQNGDKNCAFKIATPEKNYQLICDNERNRDEWTKILNFAINMSEIDPNTLDSSKVTNEGLVTMIRHGVPRRCWAILIQRNIFFLKSMNDPTPISYIFLKEAKIREIVDNYDDTNSTEYDYSKQSSLAPAHDCSLAIYPKYSLDMDPTYVSVASQLELDKWFRTMAQATCIDQSFGTCFEQSLFKLMMKQHEKKHQPVPSTQYPIRRCIWLEHRTLVYTDKSLTEPLTTLPNEHLKKKAVDLFRSIQLFTQVPLEPIGIDYHICLLQDCLQKYLDHNELRNEFFAQLTKQTTYIKHRCHIESTMSRKNSSSSELDSPDEHPELSECCIELEPVKFHTIVTDLDAIPSIVAPVSVPETDSARRTLPTKDRDPLLPSGIESSVTAIPTSTELLQALQILSLAVSLSTPRGRIRWWLSDHLSRCAATKSEPGKYAAYCLKALERTNQNGPREYVPSRIEVLGVLMRNPYNHSHPHSIPIHLTDRTTVIIGCDGSTTAEEFMLSLCKQIHIRRSRLSDFYVFANDPLETSTLHLVEPYRKLLDIFGWWEKTLRQHSGHFENTKVCGLYCKKRLLFEKTPNETERERLLIVHQYNEDIVNSRLTLKGTMILELGALCAQMSLGNLPDDKSASEYGREKSITDAMKRFLPGFDSFPDFDNNQVEYEFNRRWSKLCGRSPQDCARIYLKYARELPPLHVQNV